MAVKTFLFSEKRPPPFELVRIEYEDGSQAVGWWTGLAWDSGKPLKPLKVISWKMEIFQKVPKYG